MSATWDHEQLTQAMQRFDEACVLCIGDLILDHFVYGAVDRISPEAPVPILHIKRKEKMLGGAGNVVRNITTLGGSAAFISVIGDDDTGGELIRLIAKEENIEPYLQKEKGRISTVKTRYIAGNQQLLRADSEVTHAINTSSQKTLLKLVKSSLRDCQVLIVSDYAKGVLDDELITDIIKAANDADIPVVVDPKRKEMSVYAGATLITPNASELAAATGLPTSDDDEVVKAAKQLIKRCKLEHVLVTRSKDGMTLVSKGKKPVHLPARAREVFDVSGAGDTVVACIATALAAGCSLKESAYLANVAAGIVVGRLGTAQVERGDIASALMTNQLTAGSNKILPRENAKGQVKQWRDAGNAVGFTNGCFDLIHPGHVSLLSQAKASCDKLIVGLNSDSSVKKLKGKDRPIQSEASRALVLASLEAVDMVVIFDEDTPLALLKALKPSVLVKGADYKKSEVVGGKEVESWGGKVVLATLSEGQSTSNLVKKISA